jgi:putative membrane protein
MAEQIQKADTPDKLFLVQAAIGCQAAKKWAELAQQKSQNPQVKQLAEAIVRDDKEIAEALQKAAEQRGLEVPRVPAPWLRQELRVAQTLSGDEFDKMFLSCTKAGHAAAVSAFEDEAKIAKDPQVKEFAQKGLPKLQEHVQIIQQAAVAVGLPSGAEAQPAGQRIPPGGTEQK